MNQLEEKQKKRISIMMKWEDLTLLMTIMKKEMLKSIQITWISKDTFFSIYALFFNISPVSISFNFKNKNRLNVDELDTGNYNDFSYWKYKPEGIVDNLAGCLKDLEL